MAKLNVTRRALIGGLIALPFAPRELCAKKTVQIIIRGNSGFDQRVIDQIIAGIREAVDDRDKVIVNG